MGSGIILVLILAAFAAAQPRTAIAAISPLIPVWHVHVVNGLSNQHDTLVVHCQSKDNDMGIHNLVGNGSQFEWSFRLNFMLTTLFWCHLHKPNADVSFDAFWVEKHHYWLHERCDGRNCFWIAKDDGIYLKNNMQNVDELIHKWGPPAP